MFTDDIYRSLSCFCIPFRKLRGRHPPSVNNILDGRSESPSSDKTDRAVKNATYIYKLPITTEPTRPTITEAGDTQPIQRALVVASKGQYEIKHDFPMPHVGDNEVMIRNHYVGLNPIDWKSVDYNFCLPAFPWVIGRESSGEVVKVGCDVQGLRPGDKVWTSTYYRDLRAGCFQEYVVVPGHTALLIPETLSMQAAACLGVAAITASMTLWRWLQVPVPGDDSKAASVADSEADWLLIWGGSTITGQFATQLAVLSGLRVVTVNSALTAELSRSLGAHYVVVRDGKSSEELIHEIRTVTGGRITRAIDLVGQKTASLVLQAVAHDRPVHFAPLAMMAANEVVPDNVTAHTVEMKQFVLNPASASYADALNRLLADNKLVLPSLEVLEGSFPAVMEGLERLKKGNMGGKKLIVKV